MCSMDQQRSSSILNHRRLRISWSCTRTNSNWYTVLFYFYYIKSNNFSNSCFSGHKYGVIDITDVLRSRHTLSRSIYDLADSYRECIKQNLREPLQHRAVTICPDFWSDPYKNISYLGLNVSFVDIHQRWAHSRTCGRPVLPCPTLQDNI
jgi:hypothetical protein